MSQCFVEQSNRREAGMYLAVNVILCSFEIIFDNSEKGAAVPFIEQR